MRADYFETLPSTIKMPLPKNGNVTDVTNVTSKENLINTNMLTTENLLHFANPQNVTGVTTLETYRDIQISVTFVTTESAGGVTNSGEQKGFESKELVNLLHLLPLLHLEKPGEQKYFAKLQRLNKFICLTGEKLQATPTEIDEMKADLFNNVTQEFNGLSQALLCFEDLWHEIHAKKSSNHLLH